MRKWIPLIILLGLLLSACGVLSPAPGKSVGISSPKPGATEASSDASPITVMIRDAFCESGSYRDDIGNTWDYVLRIPMIDSEGEDAARLNRELNAALEPAVKEARNSMATGCSLMVTRVDYTVYENDHLISILCETVTDWGFESYYAVNYDASTHREVTRPQLLQRFGMSEEAFEVAAGEMMETYFREQFPSYPQDEFYRDRHDRSVDALNFKDDCCLFVNNEGQLCMIPRLYSFAGADYYYHIFALN